MTEDVVNNHPNLKKKLFGWGVAILAVSTFAAAILAWFKRRRGLAEHPPDRKTVPLALPQDIQGLTEAEAETRRLEGQDNTIQFSSPRSLGDILRGNIFTIFNFSLVGMVIAQLLLGQPLGALTSLGVIALNIGLKTHRELRTQKKLAEFEQSARPKVTVVRAGQTRSIDPNEIVTGDMLIAGPGDRIFVDGEILGAEAVVMDEALLTGQIDCITKNNGEPIYAGSFCVSGRAVYRAQKVGQERLIISRIGDAPPQGAGLTPLERIVDRVLKALLILVIVLIIFLARIYLRLDDTLVTVNEQAFIDAASIIFGIAPSSLYFMIILTYVAGTADLAKRGALVRQARSVESLAQSSVICFAQAGILTGAHVEVETIEPPDESEGLAASRLRQILGDYACNTSTNNLATRAMMATFEGSRRTVHAEAPFLSAYGWSAIAFDDADLRGVYVLAQPQALENHLTIENGAPEEQAVLEPEPVSWHKPIAHLGRFFNRAKPASDSEKTAVRHPREILPETQSRPEAGQPPDKSSPSEEHNTRPGFFQRLSGQMGSLWQRDETASPKGRAETITTNEETLVFAYHPELLPLTSGGGRPQLPEGLIPLCKLGYTEQVRPEVIDTIKAFAKTGISIKVFTHRSPERTLSILEQAGLGQKAKSLRVVTGSELTAMDDAQLAQAAAESVVFGELAPEQAGRVVESLRGQGETVAVVGDRVTDLPAMRQANLSIARQSSSQAALSFADIVLLEDSPQIMQTVLDKGQRIANGLLDVLKLNLTQVLYLALLIVGIRVGAAGFPYQPQQGTIINALTLAIPSMALSLWAASGVLPRANLGWVLARFVAPAAITMSAAATIVYRIFLERTGEVVYAQLTLTYMLVLGGLLLVLFIKLPEHFGRVGGMLNIDRRFIGLILALFFVFVILLAIPPAQDYFALAWLRQPTDYLIVGAAALAWALMLRFTWLFKPLRWRK